MVYLLPEPEPATMPGVTLALQVADQITYKHGQRVGILAAILGAWMGLSVNALQELRIAATLHDIGKLSIPAEILRKTSGFDSTECRIMQRHAPFGAFLLDCTEPHGTLAQVARYHHERWDGQGYPHGLKGQEIPLAAQITCVADAYEAMVSDRPYRVAPGHDYAVDEIRKAKGTQFSPEVVEALLETETLWRNEIGT